MVTNRDPVSGTCVLVPVPTLDCILQRLPVPCAVPCHLWWGVHYASHSFHTMLWVDSRAQIARPGVATDGQLGQWTGRHSAGTVRFVSQELVQRLSISLAPEIVN